MRFGLSADSILKEINDVLPDQIFIIDRKEIERFLAGSSPNDEKLSVYIDYLKSVYPEISSAFEIDGVELGLSEFASLFYTDIENINGFERAVQAQSVEQRAGVYGGFDFSDSSMPFSGIYLRPIIGTNAVRVAKFEIRMGSYGSMFSVIHGVFQRLGHFQKYVAGGQNKSKYESQYYSSIKDIGNIIDDAISANNREKDYDTGGLLITERGIAVFEGDRIILFLKEIVRGLGRVGFSSFVGHDEFFLTAAEEGDPVREWPAGHASIHARYVRLDSKWFAITLEELL